LSVSTVRLIFGHAPENERVTIAVGMKGWLCCHRDFAGIEGGLMKQRVKLTVSALAMEALDAIREFGDDDSVALEVAIRAYLRDKDRRGQSRPYPDFMRGVERGESAELTSVEFRIAAELWEAVEREAVELDVSPEQLLNQVVFSFAAALERGEAIDDLIGESPDEPAPGAA
jgi:hypothetical protein